MAEAEVYRVEIPIVVDDQTEEPLKQVQERVNRFQRAAEKSNQMIRERMQSLAKLRIEPVMKIRDKLTAGVLKADKLVKNLGAEQAAPVLVAQDKVSAVVLRINRLLEAMEANRLDVIADLKGPLVDEINEARTALVALSKVQAAPVAELRGKLFGQLTRAMAVARRLDQIKAEPEATLRDRVTARVRAIGSTLGKLTSRAWTVVLQAKDTVVGALGRVWRAVTSPLGLLGIGVSGAALTAGLVKAPLELAGNMEQARIGFTTMLGSAEKATAFLKELQLFAAKTPFEFPQLQEASRLLLAFKWRAEDIIPTMTAIGNAAAGLGIGPEGIERIVRALGQMRTKGKVSAEEMMQLTEAGIPAFDILQKKLGLSSKQLENLGKAGISSEVAIKALVSGMNEQFKDMMRNQSLSLLGLWSTIKDTFNMQILYRWGEGLRKAIQPKVLQLIEWFERNQATVERWGNILEETAREAADALTRHLQGAFKWIKERYLDNPEFQRLDLTGKISFLVDDIGAALDKWLSTTGAPLLGKYGAMLGGTLVKGMSEGVIAAIQESPILAFLFGAWVGTNLPAPPQVKVAVALTIVATPWIKKVMDWLIEKGGEVSPLNTDRRVHEVYEATAGLPGPPTKPGPLGLPLGGPRPPGLGMAGLPPGTTGTTLRAAKRASGGLFASPHIALVAEAGPEAIIPLSTRMRNRALALWEETGRRLGVRPYAEGGFVGPVPARVAIGGASSTSVVNHISVSVTFSGSNGESTAAALRDAAGDLAEMLAIRLEEHFQNRPARR